MLNKLQKSKKDGGFTIIEVMIVLAIVGLIMLIVFLAVPALQRNSRNTQRKSEAASISTAYAEYVNNHGGKAPTTAAQVYENAKLNFYPESAIANPVALGTGGTGLVTAPTVDQIQIYVNAKCFTEYPYSTTASATTQVQYSARGGVIVYTTEAGSGSGTNTTCISAN